MTRYVLRQDYEAALADPNSFENQMFGNRSSVGAVSGGIGSLDQFKRFLAPIFKNVQQQNEMEFVKKIDPYIEQVQQLTQETFPNIDFNKSNAFGGGPAVDFMTPNMSGENQLGVPVGDPLHDLNIMPTSERPGSINTSPFGSLLNQNQPLLYRGLGSLFNG